MAGSKIVAESLTLTGSIGEARLHAMSCARVLSQNYIYINTECNPNKSTRVSHFIRFSEPNTTTHNAALVI